MGPAPFRLQTTGPRLRSRACALAATLLAAFALGCPAPEEAALPDAGPLVPADAEALERYLKAALVQSPFDGRVFLETDMIGAPGAPAAEPGDFSTTTLQTTGVDEADLVKFDGETLFVARQPTYFYPPLPVLEPISTEPGPIDVELATPDLDCPASACPSAAITPVDGEPERVPAEIAVYATRERPAEAEEIATIALPEAGPIHGMMRVPARGGAPPLLVVVGSSPLDPWPWLMPDVSRPITFGEGHVWLWIFDVSVPDEPELLHRSKLDGDLLGVRRIGDQLVLVTRTTPYLAQPTLTGDGGVDPGIEEAELQDLLPARVIDWPAGDDAPRPLVRPEHCFVPRDVAGMDARLYYHPTLVTISMLDVRAPEEPTSVCAAGHADRMFSSTGALYLASTFWAGSSSTVVHKFAYTERGPAFRGSGRVAGMPGGSDPDFGLGESGDAFGIMTTVIDPDTFERTARLTLLGEAGDGALALEERSHLPNEREPAPIGKPGEQLYAVRFLGDRVYAVTFRRIDPLYVIDASDTRAPFIAGELEVPGFSDALHPVGPDLLVGVGKDSIEDGGADWFQGVKIELFDVSDPSAPESVDAIVIGDRGSETSARTDHHAFTSLDLGDGTSRVAIPISVAEAEAPSDDPRTWHPWTHVGLHLFEVDHATPALSATGMIVVAEAGDEGGVPGTWQDRSRLQGEAVHYVHDGEVWSADWDAPEEAEGPQ